MSNIRDPMDPDNWERTLAEAEIASALPERATEPQRAPDPAPAEPTVDEMARELREMAGEQEEQATAAEAFRSTAASVWWARKCRVRSKALRRAAETLLAAGCLLLAVGCAVPVLPVPHAVSAPSLRTPSTATVTAEPASQPRDPRIEVLAELARAAALTSAESVEVEVAGRRYACLRRPLLAGVDAETLWTVYVREESGERGQVIDLERMR